MKFVTFCGEVFFEFEAWCNHARTCSKCTKREPAK